MLTKHLNVLLRIKKTFEYVKVITSNNCGQSNLESNNEQNIFTLVFREIKKQVLACVHGDWQKKNQAYLHSLANKAPFQKYILNLTWFV